MTVHLRQPNVEEHDFGLQLFRCTQGAGRTICRGDFVTPELRHHREGIRSVFVVIDYQDSARWRGGAFSRSGALAGCTAGRWTVTVVPRPTPALSALTDPPCNWMSCFTTVSPIPRPPSERSRVRRLCTKRSNTVGSKSGAIPLPLSRTAMVTSPFDSSTSTSISPPRSVYLAAL